VRFTRARHTFLKAAKHTEPCGVHKAANRGNGCSKHEGGRLGRHPQHARPDGPFRTIGRLVTEPNWGMPGRPRARPDRRTASDSLTPVLRCIHELRSAEKENGEWLTSWRSPPHKLGLSAINSTFSKPHPKPGISQRGRYGPGTRHIRSCGADSASEAGRCCAQAKRSPGVGSIRKTDFNVYKYLTRSVELTRSSAMGRHASFQRCLVSSRYGTVFGEGKR